MGRYWDRIWGNIPIAHKLFLEIALTAAALFASNLLIYAQINRMVVRMDSVYSSNVNLNVWQRYRTTCTNIWRSRIRIP